MPDQAQPPVAANPGGHADLVAEEYLIYATLLAGIKTDYFNAPVKLFVIGDQTKANEEEQFSPEKFYKSQRGQLPAELQPVLEDYQAKNKEPQKLARAFALKSDYVLLSEKEFHSFTRGAGASWETFYRSYPTTPGFITFSRVGFNREMTRAFLYQEIRCGTLCGNASYLVLAKEQGKWRVTDGLTCWVS